MKTNYPVYDSYKPSGVEWLGEVPKHWGISKLKYILSRLVSGGTPDSGNMDYWSNNENGIPWVAIGDITQDYIVNCTYKRITTNGFRSKRLEILPKGTLLYSIFASIGKVALLGIPAVTNQAILGLLHKTEKVNQNYLRYWLNHYEKIVLSISTSNTQDNLNSTKVKNFCVYLPPLPEQRTIANFLDHQTAKIDALIAKFKKLIELLQEKRTALISQAVTKGLSPDVEMKDSGVEWLGEIPAHWNLKKLKYLATINDESLGENTDPEFKILYIDISSVDKNKGITHIEDYFFKKAPSRARRVVGDGDVIISTVRTYLRAIAPIINPPENLIVSTGFAVIRPLQELNSLFTSFVLRAPYFVDSVIACSFGVSYPAINASKLGTFYIAYPQLEEQKEIVDFIQSKISEFDNLREKTASTIAKLQEYRTALISAAVTGKIDVREWEADR